MPEQTYIQPEKPIKAVWVSVQSLVDQGYEYNPRTGAMFKVKTIVGKATKATDKLSPPR